jgi:hypothetical protein
MIRRFHLGLVKTPQGNITFTLLMHSATDFCVEQYDDSKPPEDRVTIIRPADFGKHHINGQSLSQLITGIFQEALKAN